MLQLCSQCGLLKRSDQCGHCAERAYKIEHREELLAAAQARAIWESLGREPEPEPQWRIDQEKYKGRRDFCE